MALQLDHGVLQGAVRQALQQGRKTAQRLTPGFHEEGCQGDQLALSRSAVVAGRGAAEIGEKLRGPPAA